MSLRIPFLLLASLIAGRSLLPADVIYSNFGPDGSYASSTGLIVSSDRIAGASVAIGFTPSDYYNLTSLEFVATDLIPGEGASIGIFADNAGRPGTAIESFSLDGQLGQFGSLVPVMTVNSVLQPLLEANTTYWIGLQAPSGGLLIWNLNASSSLGIASSDGAGNWLESDAPQGVLRIDGNLAPAPVIVTPVDPPAVDSFSADPGPAQNAPIPLRSGPAQQDAEQTALTPEPHSWWLMVAGLLLCSAFYKHGARFTNQK